MSPKCRTPQTLVALRFKALFSRFGTRHLKGVVVTPYVKIFYRKITPNFLTLKTKKRPVMVFLIFNSGSLQLKAEGSPTPDT